MDTINSISFLFLAIATLVNLVLAVAVYRNDTNNATNKIYAGLSAVMSVWLITNYFSFQLIFSQTVNLWLIRFSLFLATPMNTLFFLFARTVPKKKIGVSNSELRLLTALTVFIMALTLSPLVFSGTQVVNNTPSPIAGSGIVIFGVFSIIINILSVYVLVSRYKKLEGEERHQLKIVMTGILTMFGLIITTVFLPVTLFGINIFVPLLPLYSVVFLSMTAYAIVTYHLFNFKIIAVKALILGIWILMSSRVLIGTNAQIRIVDGVILGILIIFGVLLIKSVRKEIEQREKLQFLSEQLKEANDKLRELDHLKSEFLSFASHQIKAPLSSIKGFSTLIYDGTYGEVSDKVSEAAHKINESSDRLVNLVTDFLNVRKIEEGKMEYKLEMINGVEMIKNVFEELKNLAEIKNIEFNLDLQIQEADINVDIQRIRQVFQNLIENAIKYTDSGFVRVQVKNRDNNLVFSVSDSGHGISQDLLPHLFEEFKREKSDKKIEGSGLGLFFAKNIVEAHKGKIWAESEGQGKGSTFFVKLPLV